jgi:predicted RNA-binding protein YlxR (DUF448 family)
MPHTPLRRCRVCRKQGPKAELTRWVVQDGALREDPPQKAPGRGYYSCSDRCAEILNKKLRP